MKVSVLGAGGIGGYFGASIARAGHEVRLLARGEHLEAIRSNGLGVREPDGSWTVSLTASDDIEALLPADLAIVAVKSYSLTEIAPAARRLAESGAVVVPLLNGVEAFESLAAAGVPADSILPGLAAISVEKSAPGVITRRGNLRTVIVGEANGGSSRRAERVAALFAEAGADAHVSKEIRLDLWRKFLFLAAFAAASGLARAPIGAIREAPLGWQLLERAVREIGAVAGSRGVALTAEDEERTLERMRSLPAEIKPSLLLDLERGSPTEVEVLSGAVSRFGRDAGIPTPIHDTATAALAAASSRDRSGAEVR